MHKYVRAMALKDKWLNEAQNDLTSELEYVYDHFGPSTAERVYRNVIDGIDVLRQFPDSGVRFMGLKFHGAEVRTLSLGILSIIYCQYEDALIIIAIWNNYQDTAKLKLALSNR